MEAKEIRIGNLIYFSSPEDPYKVTAINSNSDETATIEGIERQDCDGTYDCSGISPLPLTEEWLLKFGFEKRENIDDSLEIILQNKIGYNIAKNKGAKHFDFFVAELYSDSVVIQYVHQLQNLYFALTGKELEIK